MTLNTCYMLLFIMFNLFKSNPKSDRPKTLGQLGEEFAQKDYEARGYKIIAKNEYNKKGLRLGELDFIAVKDKQIVFVEVKTRSLGGSNWFGTAEEAVNQFKQIKLLKAVKVFLLRNPKYLSFQPQIDVCVVPYNELDKTFKSVKIIVNAVEDWN